VWVCTTNDALDSVLHQVDHLQHQQLIFVQNGMLLPWLRQHQLDRRCTQVLLYMSGRCFNSLLSSWVGRLLLWTGSAGIAAADAVLPLRLPVDDSARGTATATAAAVCGSSEQYQLTSRDWL
jgi:hypothetical protein